MVEKNNKLLLYLHRNINKVKHIVIGVIRQSKKITRMNDYNIYFSIGENCLADEILSRFSLKSFSSPYGSGRSNIEYILAFEREEFTDFVNFDYIQYGTFENKNVLRNIKYVATKNKYNDFCTNGFEFTHHDIIGNESVRNAIIRRCNRLLSITGKNITMLYHHRYCGQTDMDLLIHHLQMLADIYEARDNKVIVYLFYQVLVSDEKMRKVESFRKGSVFAYCFYTLKEWAGDDQDVFWARCDNDLLSVMIDDIKSRKAKNNGR